MDKVRIGVIGGSGVYDMAQLTDVREVRLDTPFGAPSDAYIVGKIDDVSVAFLPRHGRGHRISPTQLNSRANIFGFKMLGVEYLISDQRLWQLAAAIQTRGYRCSRPGLRQDASACSEFL